MKKKFTSCIVLLMGLFPLSDIYAFPVVLTEAKAGYFYPYSDKFRDIYSGGGIYGIENSRQIWESLYAWTSGSLFDHSGHTKALHTRTDVLFVPVGLGLKYFWSIKCIDFYLGAGALCTYLHIHNHSPYVVQKRARWGWGGIAKFGANVNLPQSFFLDLFTDSNYTTVHFQNPSSTVNLSGFSFGLGVGYKFAPKKTSSHSY